MVNYINYSDHYPLDSEPSVQHDNKWQIGYKRKASMFGKPTGQSFFICCQIVQWGDPQMAISQFVGWSLKD